jgi:hypothetical protein
VRVVSPFRPFAPESAEHLELGAFDWIDALRMLTESVRRSCSCDTIALTDFDTTLPVPAFQYTTVERRLMLWILEVSLAYLKSVDFDRDTVMVSPDTLVFDDLRRWFQGDLTLLVRSTPNFADRPILNAVQWWPLRSRKRLVALYEQALDVAQQLPEPQIVWGADSEALRVLLAPIQPGMQRRDGLRVWMLESSLVMHSFTAAQRDAVVSGRPVPPAARPILDFKYTRKRYMRPCFDSLLGQAVTS